MDWFRQSVCAWLAAGFFAAGNRSWSLGTTQLIYLAGERSELLLSFPFGADLACLDAVPGSSRRRWRCR